jgi:hypothetical protein
MKKLLLPLIFMTAILLPGFKYTFNSADTLTGHGITKYSADVIVYGSTSAGIAAAVQVSGMGKSVVVIEPGKRPGGLTTGGLGQTDIGNKQVIGGIAREFYKRIAKKYSEPGSWNRQKREEYFSAGISTTTGEETMWTFEPKVALEVINDMISEYHIPVLYNERLDLKNGVNKKGTRIIEIIMESGKRVSGKMFIDATYEGDLMAKSGVSYVTGRESGSEYGETLNGVRTLQGIYHQFPDGVDPYNIKGDPGSGFLPHINANPGTEGTGDKRIQAYCFRMCLTDVPENMIPVEKPAGYDEKEYELLFRLTEAGYSGPFFMFTKMPNRKTDSNNKGPFSTDYIGMNYDYPEGDYMIREEIIKAHIKYQKGLVWTLGNHPRVPEDIRKEYSRWGLPKDEFTDTGNWTTQLYIREARRMVGELVMTENHCTQKSVSAPESVCMGAYTMDSHHVQRYSDKKGNVKNEGDVEVGGFKPYPIGLKAIIPKREECTNLLVPVCLSATHIAYGSIRMEPVFMILGQSAATVAVLSIQKRTGIHDLPYDEIRKRLIADGQILQN